MNGYGYGDHDMGAGAWIGMGLGMIVLAALVVWLVVMLTRDRATQAGAQAAPAPPRRETPEELLQRRLAEGAIEPDEYRARLAALRGEGGPPGPG